ncbi:lasso peptide biosynthesis B2 protein [Sphingomonas sp. JC676]|uniref:lasso peptide biosynthesis B2 protein n=1 Tax=Sphingomonas sp. JC676 TaxID=2768065 RepID=UPI001657CC70|nr:lasso peptide biosynthesis B2 protein [Sphingomonas sp. JC676]MBC9035144.1 lasso peptide biosynthesis B2 protein [Sphingomonas sp. JC676]
MFYGMPPGVYLADVDGDLVLLDARRNAYFCLPRMHAAGLKTALTNSNRFRPDVAMLDELEATGLFSMIEAPSRATAPAMTAETDLFQVRGAKARLTPARLLRLVAAAGTAYRDIWLAKPQRWFRKIAGRNARSARDDLTTLYALARLAWDAQPFFPGTARCLTSSLFLLHFLHAQGFAARWVFGVKTYPFEAHCWVEHGDVVLNDSLEHVRSFTPIVAI